jgi:UPF0755 protein
VGAVLVTAAAVLVPLLILDTGTKKTEPVPKSLVVPEGWRATQVYAAVDKALEVTPGTTARTAARMNLKLPAEAKGNPEGYLFPATYPIDARTTPASLLSFMVNTARARFGTQPVLHAARRAGLSVYQAVSIASIVQAEADTPTDMGKVARVVHNRLAHRMPLQMDSTLNYALRRSTVDTTTEDTRLTSPYNTYAQRGLPPTPIDNPGEEALRAAIAPPAGNWLYFVTVAPGDTRFTSSYEEHRRNVKEFNAHRQSAGNAR